MQEFSSIVYGVNRCCLISFMLFIRFCHHLFVVFLFSWVGGSYRTGRTFCMTRMNMVKRLWRMWLTAGCQANANFVVSRMSLYWKGRRGCKAYHLWFCSAVLSRSMMLEQHIAPVPMSRQNGFVFRKVCLFTVFTPCSLNGAASFISVYLFRTGQLFVWWHREQGCTRWPTRGWGRCTELTRAEVLVFFFFGRVSAGPKWCQYSALLKPLQH